MLIASSSIAERATILTGGKIYTVDDKFTIVEALAIRQNKVLATGSLASVQAVAGSDSIAVDLEGNTVLPGFVDPHTHPVAGSANSVFIDVGIERFRSVNDALVYMREVATRGKPWLLFLNLDLATQTFDSEKLTIKDLDSISTERPLVVWQAGGHRMTVNSVMLDLLGINKATPNPAGSQYGRFEDGSPDGNVAGTNALLTVIAAITPYIEFDRLEGTKALAGEFLQKGLTSLGIAGISTPADWEVLLTLAADEAFPIRTRTYVRWGSRNAFDAASIGPGIGNVNARIVGWKISSDGSNQAFTGFQREPYLNRTDTGLAYLSQDEINHAVIEGSNRGGQMAIHGNGDAAIDRIIEAVELARKSGVHVKRPRIEHCSIVQDDQILKLKQQEISCSFLIAHVLLWGEAFRDKVFGSDKAAKLDRTGSFEAAGLEYSLHTDYPVSTLTPLEMIEVAMTRELLTDPGVVLAREERASLESAIRAVTSVPAWQLMSETEIGSLEPGKLADFVILNKDPAEVKASSVGDIKVVETWIDGKKVFAESDNLR